LLSRLNVDEIEAVLAHELGHFKHKHIIKRMIVSFVLALLFFQALDWASQQVWFYTELGVYPQLGRANDALALILFFLVTPTFTFWAAPLGCWFSRRDEFQADRYAAEQCSAESLAAALIKLYDDNAATLTPDPLHSAFYDSHPSAVQRIQQLKHG
jgi:STE24 endopeptidase